MNMMELHASSRSKFGTSYNMKHGDTKVYILIFSRLPRQLSHSASASASRILEDKVMKICDENMIKTTYYDQ